MKFVPLLGRALKDMALSGGSDYALPEFAMTRRDEKTGKSIITDPETDKAASEGLGIITQRSSERIIDQILWKQSMTVII